MPGADLLRDGSVGPDVIAALAEVTSRGQTLRDRFQAERMRFLREADSLAVERRILWEHRCHEGA